MANVKSNKSKNKRSKKPTTRQKVTKGAAKWVVAVDPFSELNPSDMAVYVKGLAGPARATLYGTYILAPESLNWTGEFSGPWIKKYKPVAEAKAAEVGSELGFSVEVVPCRTPGLRQSVATMIKYTAKIRAEMVVIATHARRGIDRLVLGSYAESVILASKTPVLVVNPSQPLPTVTKKILVPTDLSPQSVKFTLKVAAFAEKVGASVDLFYKRPDPLDPIIQQGVYAVGGGWVSLQSYIEDDTRDKEKKLNDIVSGLRKRGLQADSVMATASTSLIDSINQAAEQRGANMIAVLTQTGPLAATVLGSVARGLVRTAKVPVLIWR